MTDQRDRWPPLMWVISGPGYNNVVVLTADVLYSAAVKHTDLARIDKGLEDGAAADELLPAKAWRIPLADIERIEFKHARIVVHQMMNKDVSIRYYDGRKTRSLTLQLASAQMRDEVVQNLNERVGPWPVREADESPWRILARYLWIITVIVLLTLFGAGLEIFGQLNSGPAFIMKYLDAFGIWGILAPGVLLSIVVLITGIRQLRTPPIIVTYEPAQARR